jgi:hypothetical protein
MIHGMRRTMVHRLYRASYAATTPTIGNTVMNPLSWCLMAMIPVITSAMAGSLIHIGRGVRWCGSGL